jgi:FkbM family methyltransferase
MLKLLLWPLRKRRIDSEAGAASSSVSAPERDYEESLPVRKIGVGTAQAIFCSPNPATAWRVQTLFTKEPDTIEWIGSFAPEDVLVDIGANVGMYTIWAAKTRGVRVFAFEPEAQNYALLNRNIVINKLGDKVIAYCAALSDESRFSLLHLSTLSSGGSSHTFGEDLDHNLHRRKSVFAQGCISTTLDALVTEGIIPTPTHIKVDVDGLEHKVFAGCRATLRNPLVKSVLVEINSALEEHRKIVIDLARLGFAYSEAQVAAARRNEGPFTGVGNYVFRR